MAIVPRFLLDRRVEGHLAATAPQPARLAHLRLGLFALTYALIEANSFGWTSGRIIAAFASRGRRSRRSSCSSCASAYPCSTSHSSAAARSPAPTRSSCSSTLAMFGVFFFLSLYMQNVLGYSAVQAARVPPDYAPRRLSCPARRPDLRPLGSRCAADPRDDARRGTAPLLLHARRGASATGRSCLRCSSGHRHALCDDARLGGRPRAASPSTRPGVGSAVLNSSRQVGGSIGIALIGAIIAHESRQQLDAGSLRCTVSRSRSRSLLHRLRRRSAWL